MIVDVILFFVAKKMNIIAVMLLRMSLLRKFKKMTKVKKIMLTSSTFHALIGAPYGMHYIINEYKQFDIRPGCSNGNTWIYDRRVSYPLIGTAYLLSRLSK